MHEDGQKVHLVTQDLQIKMAGVSAIFSPPRFPDSSRYQMHMRADGGESQGPRSTRGGRAATVKLIMPSNVA